VVARYSATGRFAALRRRSQDPWLVAGAARGRTRRKVRSAMTDLLVVAARSPLWSGEGEVRRNRSSSGMSAQVDSVLSATVAVLHAAQEGSCAPELSSAATNPYEPYAPAGPRIRRPIRALGASRGPRPDRRPQRQSSTRIGAATRAAGWRRSTRAQHGDRVVATADRLLELAALGGADQRFGRALVLLLSADCSTCRRLAWRLSAMVLAVSGRPARGRSARLAAASVAAPPAARASRTRASLSAICCSVICAPTAWHGARALVASRFQRLARSPSALRSSPSVLRSRATSPAPPRAARRFAAMVWRARSISFCSRSCSASSVRRSSSTSSRRRCRSAKQLARLARILAPSCSSRFPRPRAAPRPAAGAAPARSRGGQLAAWAGDEHRIEPLPITSSAALHRGVLGAVSSWLRPCR